MRLLIFQAVNQDQFVWWEGHPHKREELRSVHSPVQESLYGDQCAMLSPMELLRLFADNWTIQDQVHLDLNKT